MLIHVCVAVERRRLALVVLCADEVAMSNSMTKAAHALSAVTSLSVARRDRQDETSVARNPGTAHTHTHTHAL